MRLQLSSRILRRCALVSVSPDYRKMKPEDSPTFNVNYLNSRFGASLNLL